MKVIKGDRDKGVRGPYTRILSYLSGKWEGRDGTGQ